MTERQEAFLKELSRNSDWETKKAIFNHFSEIFYTRKWLWQTDSSGQFIYVVNYRDSKCVMGFGFDKDGNYFENDGKFSLAFLPYFRRASDKEVRGVIKKLDELGLEMPTLTIDLINTPRDKRGTINPIKKTDK